MKLRRLNPDGVAKFSEYLDLANLDSSRLVPRELLESPEFSAETVNSPEMPNRKPTTRFQLAELLNFTLAESQLTEEERDVGLWTWLTLYYFEAVCPSSSNGTRKLRERAAYVPEPNNFQRYYRHLLLGPYLIFRFNSDAPERAMAFLCKPPNIIDDVVAQIAARQEFITNQAVVEATTILYYDSNSTTLRTGAGGKGKGSARRLVSLLAQLDVTWDLYSMTSTEFLGILPAEFDRFKVRVV